MFFFARRNFILLCAFQGRESAGERVAFRKLIGEAPLLQVQPVRFTRRGCAASGDFRVFIFCNLRYNLTV